MNKTYLIFRKNGGIQESCTWFRYRDEAVRYNKEHFDNMFKVKPFELDSLDDVDPCEPNEFVKSSRCEHCWRKIKSDYLKHIGDINMKKEKLKIDDSQNYNDMFSKKERMQISKATKPLEDK